MLDSPHHAGAGNALDLPGFGEAFDPDGETLDIEPRRPWYRQRRWLIAGSAALLVIMLAGTIAVVMAQRTPQITYLTAQAQQGNLVTTVSATGPLQSGVYPANFAASGRLTEIDVAVGQQVSAGQVLAKIDPTALQDALNSAQTQVNSAQTSLNNAYTNDNNVINQENTALSTAYINEQNAITACGGSANCIQLAENQYTSAVDQATSAKASASAQITTAQAQLRTAQATLQTAQDNLTGATLTAPHAGTVAAINGMVGGSPGSGASSAGATAASGFIVIDDLSTFEVVAQVNEADIAQVAVNQVVNFTVSAFGAQRFLGTVASISPQGTSTAGVVTYPVTIAVTMSAVGSAHLLPQMTATIAIVTAQRTGVLLVPASAVTFARTAVSSGLVTRAQVLAAVQQAQQMAPGTTGGAAAFVLERAGTQWTVKPVVLGLSNGTADEVVAGLSAGETVVTGQTGGTATASGTPGGRVRRLWRRARRVRRRPRPWRRRLTCGSTQEQRACEPATSQAVRSARMRRSRRSLIATQRERHAPRPALPPCRILTPMGFGKGRKGRLRMASELISRARLGAGMRFDVATGSGFTITMDADPAVGGQQAGPGPMEVMLAALAGCVGITVISLLRKQRQDVSDYELRLVGRQAEQHPHTFTAVTIEHHLTGHGLSRGAISRAVDLAEERYCPVSTTIAALARISHSIVLHEAPAAQGSP